MASKSKSRKKNGKSGSSFIEKVGIASAVNAAVNGAVQGTYAAWHNGKAVKNKETSLKEAAMNVLKATADGANQGAVYGAARGTASNVADIAADKTDSRVAKDVLHGMAPMDIADAAVDAAKKLKDRVTGKLDSSELADQLKETAAECKERVARSAAVSTAVGAAGRLAESLFSKKKKKK